MFIFMQLSVPTVFLCLIILNNNIYLRGREVNLLVRTILVPYVILKHGCIIIEVKNDAEYLKYSK